MESLATWMEEQFDDDEQRQPSVPPVRPARPPEQPLDTFRTASFQQYGNWLFFEYLSEHYGRGIVKAIWTQRGVLPGRRPRVLRPRDPRRAGCARRARPTCSPGTPPATLVPAHTYPEGAAFPASGYAADSALDPGDPHHRLAVVHRAPPRLAERARGPGRRPHRFAAGVCGCRSTRPTPRPAPRRTSAWCVGTGRSTHALVPLTAARCRADGPCPSATPRSREVTVTLANTSARFHGCLTDGRVSCSGFSDAPHPTFRVKLTAFSG